MFDLTDEQKATFTNWLHSWSDFRLADQALKLKKLLNTEELVESFLVDDVSDLFDMIRDECVCRVAALGESAAR